MSPEQLRGESLDVRTDLFSFGLVLYEMSTGQRAFAGSTIAVVAAGILGDTPAPPRMHRAGLPPRLEQTILKALEKDRAQRWQTAADIRDALTRVRRGEHGALETPVHTAVPPTRRSHRRALAFALFIAASAATSGWYLWQRTSAPLPTPAQQEAPRPAVPPPAPPAQTDEPVAPRPMPTPAITRPTERAALTQAGGSIPNPPAQTPSAPSPTLPDGVGNAPGGGRGLRPRNLGNFGSGAPALVKMLRNLPPETYDLVYASNDPDAMRMALQVREVLSNGGWTNAITTEIAAPQAQLGIFAPMMTPGVKALVSWASRSNVQLEYRRAVNFPRPRIVVGRQTD
jgi:serine/threonine protein kinase